MSDVGEQTPVEEVQVTSQSGMTNEEALQQVLKTSLAHDGLARGLRECLKALDRREARLCILSASCDEDAYVKAITAQCETNKIDLMRVGDSKALGEWAGLCKIDREGKPRKVVGSSCVVIKDYGAETEGLSVIQAHLEKLRSSA